MYKGKILICFQKVSDIPFWTSSSHLFIGQLYTEFLLHAVLSYNTGNLGRNYINKKCKLPFINFKMLYKHI